MSVNGSGSPIVAGQVSRQLSPLWWTYKLATSTPLPSVFQGFGDIRGSANVTPDITNMTKAFELPAPESFTLYSPRITFPGTTAADQRSFTINYVFRLIVAGKILLEAPVDFFPGGAGVSTDPQNGNSDVRAITSLDPDIIQISSGMTFRCEFVGNSFSTTGAFCMRVYLDGRYSRAIG